MVTKEGGAIVGLEDLSWLHRKGYGNLVQARSYTWSRTRGTISRPMRRSAAIGTLRGMAQGSDPMAASPRPPLSKRITASQWEAIDVVVAVLLAAITVPVLASFGHDVSHHLPLWAEELLGLAATLPLAVRRRWPLAVLAVVTAAFTVAGAFAVSFGPGPGIALAVYIVATHYDRRRSLMALAATEAALLAALVVALVAFAKGDTVSPVVAAAAWFVGDAVRARRAYDAGLAEQAAQRQWEEVEQARQSAIEERVRIARELHDVVAHSLSVIAIQAGVGRHVLDTQPEEARQALAAVETTSRDALAELRRVVGLLRQADRLSPALSPAPGLGDLPQLVDQVRAAGVPVKLDLRGEHDSVSQGVGLSIYRIVQEALTNVVKHAGPASALVRVVFEAGVVDVEVVDNGLGPRPSAGDMNGDSGAGGVGSTQPIDSVGSPSRHHGIIGMRERVALFGGSLTVGAGPAGGFRVSAHLPLERADRQP
jgi:signal transduction histidine kinase